MELNQDQIDAILNATTSKFSIVTGGAGTGKTTIIYQIAKVLFEKDESIELCAFAGKAAARLKEATRRPTSTIHRMLGFNGERFSRDTLRYDAVIIDEASMVSADLMYEIIVRNPKRLILVGDEAQLQPVGVGQPFHDIIDLRPDLVRHLKKCYRNSEAIFKAAATIREGQFPERQDTTAAETWEVVEVGTPENAHSKILELIRGGFIDFKKDIILIPRNGEIDQPATIASLNADIVDLVNPRQGDEKWKVGDRVINGKNFAEADVWNGTTGTIHAIDSDDRIWVELDIPIVDQDETKDFENPIYKDKVLFDKDMKKSLTLAYALTVHKSQGSQYRRVIFLCITRDRFKLLTRQLIYTAVTRTQEHCIVLANVNAFYEAIGKISRKETIIQELAKGVNANV